MPVAISTFVTNLRAKIVTDMVDLSSTEPAFINSHSSDSEDVVRGANGRYALRYLLRGWEFVDSNVTRRLLQVQIEFRHRLAITGGVTTGEDAMALDVVTADLVQLMLPDWWRTLAGAVVYDAVPVSSFSERVGDQMKFGVTVNVTLPD